MYGKVVVVVVVRIEKWHRQQQYHHFGWNHFTIKIYGKVFVFRNKYHIYIKWLVGWLVAIAMHCEIAELFDEMTFAITWRKIKKRREEQISTLGFFDRKKSGLLF